MEISPPILPQLSNIKKILSDQERTYARLSLFWKAGYRVLLVLSALFSSASALVGEFSHFKIAAATDVAAILAASAAIITTLIAALNFETNWLVNRKSRQMIRVLKLEAEKTTADPDKLLTGLQEVLTQRTEEAGRQD